MDQESLGIVKERNEMHVVEELDLLDDDMCGRFLGLIDSRYLKH